MRRYCGMIWKWLGQNQLISKKKKNGGLISLAPNLRQDTGSIRRNVPHFWVTYTTSCFVRHLRIFLS